MRVPALCALLASLLLAAVMPTADAQIPTLRTQGTATQLIVDGEPFLVLGGETGNSSGEPDYLRPHWQKFRDLHLNTLLVPVYWDLVEPQEGEFDFASVDGLLADARAHDMRLVLLWFGSWKNSMSAYAPAWVKRDAQRFPRARDRRGIAQEILSPFYPANLEADARAFTALMAHLRKVDGRQHTVLMVQVENEVGMLPDARDHSAAAGQAFAEAVPAVLMEHLSATGDELAPELAATWRAAGGRTAGSWSEVFGADAAGEEIFMAWHFARYLQEITRRGKAEYPLPMFVNAALIRPGHQPGQYPSAGPLPHLADVWRAGAPDIDFLAPDIYFQNFTHWARLYTRNGNPLFIPEALPVPEAGLNGMYAIAGLDAMGFSPFSIETLDEETTRVLAGAYQVLGELAPLILRHQGQGSMAGLLSEGVEQRQPQRVELGYYVLQVTFERPLPAAVAEGLAAPGAHGPSGPRTRPSGGLAIALAPDEFIIAGIGITVTVEPRAHGRLQAGLLSVEQGRFVEGQWQRQRWLNGDQTHQGRHLRIGADAFETLRVKLYSYD